MAEISALKRQRGIIKGSVTRINTFVETCTALTPESIANLEERRLTLERCWNDYNAVQTQIEIADENEVIDRENFEETYFKVGSKMRQMLNGVRPQQTAMSAHSSYNTASLSEPRSNTRLPKLNLPVFSGNYEEWVSFHDTFTSSIRDNRTLDDVQRFQYLKASLAGEAAELVQSLKISEANYAIAWELLEERYDNKRLIVQKHIKAIMDLPHLSRENAVELRKIADGSTKNLRALSALDCPTEKWDQLIIYILAAKLDNITAREWQNSLKGSELPSFKQFTDFINHRVQMLEATGPNTHNVHGNQSRSQAAVKRQSSCMVTVNAKCIICDGNHPIYTCKKFIDWPTNKRIFEIRKRKICVNCLRSTNHGANSCKLGSCKTCGAKHNTLLHINKDDRELLDDASVSKAADKAQGSAVVTHTSVSHKDDSDVLLSTAIIQVYDSQNKIKTGRVLLDSGSQANFITDKFLKTLGIKSQNTTIAIHGINGKITNTNRVANIKVKSRFNSFNADLKCIVTDKITDQLPNFAMKRSDFRVPRNIKLADPQFYLPAEIDMLIGVDLFWKILCVGQIKASFQCPTIQKTRFGWVLAGRAEGLPYAKSQIQSFHARVSNAELHEQLTRFWNVDEISHNTDSYTLNERLCEDLFNNNVRQNSQGRYIVKLPVKEKVIRELGESKSIATRRLLHLEKRLSRDRELKDKYTEFLREYMSLGHMRRVRIADTILNDAKAVYIPHHCVLKDNSASTKLRVVFDASCKTSSGVALNDALFVGPVVQQDLMSIVLRFRLFIYVMTADIVKMYRQILVDPDQTHLQRILWRDQPERPIEEYELLTLTYGTASASYLATRCLKHLAMNHAHKYKIGAKVVLRDFLVDDLLTGADCLNTLFRIKAEVVELLGLGAFELSKWLSNHRDLVESKSMIADAVLDLDKGNSSKILGIQWQPNTDTFHFSYTPASERGVVTKRSILSDTAKLFDPLGLLGPIIVIAKLILQVLWTHELDWDESVPTDIHSRWTRLRGQLVHVNLIQIPRCVKPCSGVKSIQIHGFSDASQQAYGACVYVRGELLDEGYQARLLCSKSRVAPIRAVSLPRLELCAAVLLAQLMKKVRDSLDNEAMEVVLWTDSTIVLNWINSNSRKWQTYIANRVGEIQRLTDASSWRHVPTAENPADLISRGVEPLELSKSSLWWEGPRFLSLDARNWPKGTFKTVDELPEQKKVAAAATLASTPNWIDIIVNKFSNINKIYRIIAYCFRFIRRSMNYSDKCITVDEMQRASRTICKLIQRQYFSDEYVSLLKSGCVDRASRLLSLNPFLDEHGLIRVGGRIRRSQLDRDARHQILLPSSHHLTDMIIRNEHVRNLHTGVQGTLSFVRQRFWPIAARSRVRKIVRECVTCFRCKPVFSEAKMSDLPASRVQPSIPFTHCGIDYAGPLTIREGKRRNARNHKAYVAVFVCFATKSCHLELVSDLTTEALLAALKRFIARRHKPSCIYSDNGTAFVGANKELVRFVEATRKNLLHFKVKEYLQASEISWSFIPPSAPHFGGLWEAAVKSMKTHLCRIVGNAHLTFEELATTLCEIEAILNSRPITTISEDPNDLECLTPGHFLVGCPLNDFPYPDILDIRENRLSRWQRVEQLRQHFWRRWSHEYLHSLQERTKWRCSKGAELEPGKLVIIKQQSLRPLQWLMGRIEAVHPAADGVSRVATVKTNSGSYVRPLTKLAIVPVE